MLNPVNGPRSSETNAWRQFRAAMREWTRRVRSGELDPERFSRSAAAGVLLGLLPIHGFQSLLWLVFVAILPIDPWITWLCSWVGNAATAVPLTWLELELGALLCTGRAPHITSAQLRDPAQYADLGLQLVAGTLCLGAVVSFAVYFVARRVALNWQQRARGETSTEA